MTLAAAILGVGLVHPVGNLQAFLQQFHDGDLSAPAVYPPIPTKTLQQRLPTLPLRRVPHYARLGLLAALDALPPADASGCDPATGLVIGSAYASSKMSLDFMDTIVDNGPRLSSPTAFSHAVNNVGAGLLSLHLGLRGPCQTVTQFALSFAGALHTACLLLHSGMARQVLTGCIEEDDARCAYTCALHHPTLPNTEGAVFFLLGLPDATHPRLHVTWDATPPPTPPDSATAFSPPAHAALYGYTPLAHALETVLALDALHQHGAGAAYTSVCTDVYSGRSAAIHVCA